MMRRDENIVFLEERRVQKAESEAAQIFANRNLCVNS